MLKRLTLVAAAVACVSWSAFGRASYPEYAGEMGVSAGDYDLDTGATEFTVQYTARFPAVVLDDRYPNELQPWAQRRSSVILGMTTLDYESPANEMKRVLVVNAVDFMGGNVGLTASYGKGDLAASAERLERPRYASFVRELPGMLERDQVMSFGVILNQFPGYMVRLDIDFNSYTEGSWANNWEAVSLAAANHPDGSRLWLEAGLATTVSNAWGDRDDAYLAAAFYLGNALAIGASAAVVTTDDSSRASSALFARVSTSKTKIDLGVERDLDNDGDWSWSLGAAFRF